MPKIVANGHVYEMFGNSKHYSVQSPLLYKPAEMTNKPLTAKYFIYDVVQSAFYYFLFLKIVLILFFFYIFAFTNSII